MKSALMALSFLGCLPDTPPSREVEKPTFELLSFEQYKAAYPDIRGMECGLEEQFDTFIHVYGVTFAAMPNTPVPEIIHAGKVWAQLIDSDQNFVPDDPNIYEWHQRDQHDGKRVIVILVDDKSHDNRFSRDKRAERVWMNQALRPGHSGVGHSRDGEMDIAVEELFHRLSEAYGQVYADAFWIPEIEEFERSTRLSRALDKARGMDRQSKPVNGRWVYPKQAWYTYDAVGCGWRCQAFEYLWMGWSTNIGYHEMLTRAPDVPRGKGRPGGWAEQCHGEWKVANREQFQQIDKDLYALLNESGLTIPNTIPYGEYGGQSVLNHGYEVEVNESEGAFVINRAEGRTLSFKRGNTYYFDQSLASNTDCAFLFSTTKDGTHGGGDSYQMGVTRRGKPGMRGAYTRITVPSDAPDTLYYYCTRYPGSAADGVIKIIGASE